MGPSQIEEVGLGPVAVRTDIASFIGTFNIFREYKVTYTRSVVTALVELYQEYNRSFVPLIAGNREWSTDYRFCTASSAGVNYLVQVDMIGLPHTLLREIASCSPETVREILRHRIFEIENSLATYQMYEKLFAHGSADSIFRIR